MAILLLAALLRLANLTGQSLWWDEVVAWQQARGGLGDLIAATAADNYPPLFNILIHFSMLLFGETEVALRLPSAVLGIVNVLAVYWVGRIVGGRPVALIAAALLAVSSFHIWYSGEARMYALLCCAATLFAGSAASFISRPGWTMGLCSALAGSALLYSHPYGALTFAAIVAGAVAILLGRQNPRAAFRFVALQVLPAMSFLPWAIVMARRAAAIDLDGFWIAQVTPWNLFQTLLQLTGGPFLFAAVVVGIRWSISQPPKSPPVGAPAPLLDHRQGLVILLCWAALPLVAGIVLSLTIQPMIISRYLIGSLPALLILTAIGFTRLSDRLAYVALAIAALTGFFAYGLRPRDDFRGVAKELHAELRQNDCVLMIPEAAVGLSYYYRETLPCAVAARQFEAASFPIRPSRIFVLATLDADITKLTSLGRETGRKAFGPTQLIILEP